MGISCSINVSAMSAGKIHFRNTIEQLKLVGPRSMGVSLLTAGFVGMVFTIQVCDYLFMSPCVAMQAAR